LPLETTISTLIEGAKITFSRVQLSHETLNATASSLSKYAEKIDKFVESTDLHTAEYRLRRKVNELSNVKDEVLSALQPITKEANSILGTLKTIISED
jgi:prefoldin subunit 5